MADVNVAPLSAAAEGAAHGDLGTEVIQEGATGSDSEVELVPPSTVEAARPATGEVPAEGTQEAIPEQTRQTQSTGATSESDKFPGCTDIPQGGVGVSDSLVDLQEWRLHIVAKDKVVKLTELCWDRNAELGQVRKLRMDVVKYYVQRLLAEGEPVKPVDVFTKMLPGVCPLQ